MTFPVMGSPLIGPPSVIDVMRVSDSFDLGGYRTREIVIPTNVKVQSVQAVASNNGGDMISQGVAYPNGDTATSVGVLTWAGLQVATATLATPIYSYA